MLCAQDASDDSLHMEVDRSNALVEISTTAAILFVVIASCFLVMFYKLMSFWFVEILVVLFCIGGIEVLPFVLCRLCHYDYNFLIKTLLFMCPLRLMLNLLFLSTGPADLFGDFAIMVYLFSSFC